MCCIHFVFRFRYFQNETLITAVVRCRALRDGLEVGQRTGLHRHGDGVRRLAARHRQPLLLSQPVGDGAVVASGGRRHLHARLAAGGAAPARRPGRSTGSGAVNCISKMNDLLGHC